MSDLWSEASTPDGKVYWFNRVTRETTWDRPAAMDPVAVPDAPPLDPAAPSPVPAPTPAAPPVEVPPSPVTAPVAPPVDSPVPDAPLTPTAVTIATPVVPPVSPSPSPTPSPSPSASPLPSPEPSPVLPSSMVLPAPAPAAAPAPAPSPAPAPAPQVPASPVAPAAPALKPEDNPANWKTAEANGRTYYYNTVTKATAWEAPACLAAASPPSPPPPPPSGPPPPIAEPQPQPQPPASPGPGPSPSLSDWREVRDAKSGRVYWWNAKTQQASWHNPFAPGSRALVPEPSSPRRPPPPPAERRVHFDPAHIFLEGNLDKLSPSSLKGWQTRYFTLFGDCLVYGKSKTAEPLGMLPLHAIQECSFQEPAPKHWAVVYLHGVNVRDSPATDGKLVAKLERAQIVVELESKGEWIRHDKGWTIKSAAGTKAIEPASRRFYLLAKGSDGVSRVFELATETMEEAAKWLTTIRELVRYNKGKEIFDTTGKFWKEPSPIIIRRITSRKTD